MIKVGGHRVLVKPVDVADTDPALAAAKRIGLELAKSHSEREQNAVDRGVIVQIGRTAATDFDGDLWFSEGQEVVFARYAGKRVEDPETKEPYIVLNAEDILCTLGE